MKNSLTTLLALTCSITLFAQQPSEKDNIYGDAIASSILRLDENVTFYCDIQDFPPVIGKDMPVRLKALRPAPPQDNLKILVFLNDLLFSKTKPVKQVVLKNIERGESFCFLADIEVDGSDLCDLLIQQQLARKVIEVGTQKAAIQTLSVQPEEKSETQPQTQQETQAPQEQPITSFPYICSKSSKVFHKSTCLHAKQFDVSSAVTFSTKEEALATGRRPCKVCKP